MTETRVFETRGFGDARSQFRNAWPGHAMSAIIQYDVIDVIPSLSHGGLVREPHNEKTAFSNENGT